MMGSWGEGGVVITPDGGNPGDINLVGDNFPSSKLLAARAATAEAFSFSSSLILTIAWGSGTMAWRMLLIWSSETGDLGTKVVLTVLMLDVWIGGSGLVKLFSTFWF